ncbi:hypothetical protein TCAL_15801 [Tigriopus californicus]|uniref:Band 7 domain-containing protein n=1 Tax=Tigriopus californicus TaxID=6832 RepID=A0A553NPQ8_TIGCA|nr:hypothetical protein TCAL_15801 [Tigriopus californicus]
MCFNVGVVTCGPNEAVIISGVFHGGNPSMIVGGRAIVIPCLQKVQRIPLNIMTLKIESPRVYTSQGVAISVTGVAQVQINGTNEKMLKTAAEIFGSKTAEEILFVSKETLEGHQRAIMGNMTVEEIYRDRKTFSERVFAVASTDFIQMGIKIALGQGRTAEVRRDARIGEAEAQKEATMAGAMAKEQSVQARLLNDTEIARAKRDYELKKATYDVEVNTAEAEAQLAFQLRAATINQQIKEQDFQVKVVERIQEIEVAEQEIQRQANALDSLVKKPAEAEKYRLEKIAQANRLVRVLEAEAEAEAETLRGEAKAFAIEARAKAEAEEMAKKADAWNEYGEVAKVHMILETLPVIARDVAKPLSKVNKITMVTDGPGEIGASKITGEVLQIMQKMPELVKDMTGVDITKQMVPA